MKDERWVWFDEETDMVEQFPTPSLNLPDLREIKCLKPKDGSPFFHFYCEPSGRYMGGCTNCGSAVYHRNGYLNKDRFVRDVNIGLIKVDIRLRVPRYQCSDCGVTFAHRFESVPEGRQFTYRAYEQICVESYRHSFSEVAANFGCDVGTVQDYFDEYTALLESQRSAIVAPEVLAIDEKHIEDDMRGILVNGITGELLEMTPDNKSDTMAAVITGMIDYDKNIRIITSDMAPSYRSMIQTILPNAKQIVDKWHVLQLLSVKIRAIKTKLVSVIADRVTQTPDGPEKERLADARERLNRNSYLFRFSRKKLSTKPRTLSDMAEACEAFPEINHLRLLKEGFEAIYDAEDRAAAEAAYNEWLKLLPPTRKKEYAEWKAVYGVEPEYFKEILSFARTVNSWHKEIFGYFDPGCRYTNAVAEGTNSLIQDINEIGNGYTFERLRAKAIFWRALRPISYGMKSVNKKVRVPKPSAGFSETFSKIGMNDLFSYITVTVAVDSVVKNVGKQFKPLSVLSYFDDSKEYYDFDDEP